MSGSDSPIRLLTETQRGLLETKLQNMEAGRFQEFMIKFLPKLDGRYEGVVRFGGTEFGKTKPGVPDIRKTFESGDEIGIECGTELNYWTPPEDQNKWKDEWKPASDALKCMGRMTRPVEIVVAASRPIPQGYPSVKTTLIDFLKKHSPATVRPISSEDIASWFESNAFSSQGLELLRQFFPEVFESVNSTVKAGRLEATLRHAESAGFPVGIINGIVQDNPTLSEAEVSGLVQEQLGYDSSRFRFDVGRFEGLARLESAPAALRRPQGRCLQLLGIPKIGKSWLCREALQSAGIPGAWYLAPDHEALLAEFVDAFLVDLFAEFWPRRDAIAARRKNKLLQLDLAAARTPSQSKVLVVENALLLRRPHLLEVNEAVRQLKSKGLFPSIGLVLITNKTIAPFMGAIDETCVAPIWTRDQLLRLLDEQKISIRAEEREKYGDLLSTMAGGHPLTAVSLARRYPSGAALVTAMATQAKPDPQDVDLSNELKNVLYQEILTTADKQNFIQRLSILVGRADSRVLEWLRVKVQPPIQGSVEVLFEEIGGAVLDGDPRTGLAVSPTFKQIASKRLGTEESLAVRRMMAEELFRPVGRTFDGGSVIDSAFYSVMAGDFEKAFAAAAFILFGIGKDKPDPAIVRSVLSRLDFLDWIKVPDDEGARISYYSYLVTKVFYGSKVDDAASKGDLLEKVDLEWLRTHEFTDKPHARMAEHLRDAVIGQRILRLPKDAAPLGVLEAFVNRVSSARPPKELSVLVDILPLLIAQLPLQHLKALDLSGVIDMLAVREISALSDLALLIGSAVHEKPELAPLIDRPKDSNAHRELFFGLARAYRMFVSGRPADAAKLIDAAERDSAVLSLKIDDLGASFLQFKGDTYFELGDAGLAIQAYEKSNSLADKWDLNVPSWNYLRMGLIAKEVDAAVAWLDRAMSLFEDQKNFRMSTRALGASATILLRAKAYELALGRAETLASLFHQGKKEAGPPLRLLTSQILRRQSDLSGESLPDKMADFPEPEPRYYIHVPDDLMPEAGGVVTFNCLARLAATAGLHAKALALFRKAFEFEAKLPIDHSARVMNMLMFLSELEPADIDWDELRRLIALVLPDRPPTGDRQELFFFESLLRPLRLKAVQDPGRWGSVAVRYLSELATLVRAQPQAARGQWEMRINAARGDIHLAAGARKEAAESFREAFAAALADEQWALAVEVGGQLSFALVGMSGSLTELAEAQRDTLRALGRSAPNDEQLRNFGINLFRCWRALNWRRLSASDLRVKGMLQDGALAMKEASTDEAAAAPAMIALLARALEETDLPKLTLEAGKLPERVRELLA